ncbi:hypothetical protein [Actinomadura sp. 7K534]|uniref:hypothetical protein n=1 Tax=Actinomadura sp. 7K534 TaxID=2530366 RepID=UPI001044E533|nr:hypothetical protein [Actinomadura sp. 7K534]TDB87048.1 hypothetical protein E1266_33295 [Actinomadura sp. 7K534]
MSEDESLAAERRDHTQLAFPIAVPEAVKSPAHTPNRFSLAAEDDEIDDGGCFHYESLPDLFAGRIGFGPLRVFWDTNILIDFAKYGSLMWGDEEFPVVVDDPQHQDELLALYQLVQLWMMRDIRFKVSPRQLKDARRGLSADEWQRREYQILQINGALQCLNLDADIDESVHYESLPLGSGNDAWDESLVGEAIDKGCHVFLTQDKRLRRRLHERASSSLVCIMAPSALIRTLIAAGEFGPGRYDSYLPDSHKWTHLMAVAEYLGE